MEVYLETACLKEEYGGVLTYCLYFGERSMEMYLETTCLEEEYGDCT